VRIILLRHGRPAYSPPRTIGLDRLGDEVERYNEAEIAGSTPPPFTATDLASQVDLLLASSLRRSIQSAAILTSTKPIVDQVFREAEIPTRLPFPGGTRLFPLAWIAIARVMWLCGWSGGSESFRSARRRAATACERLTQLASQHGDVMLVGHQMFNLLIARELRLRGWRGPAIPPMSHWSRAIYERTPTGLAE
jgi:broad specificity phosphatase PhoE